MSATLRKAFARASSLPKPAQDQLAAQLLEDIKGEESWDKMLAATQGTLEKLAAKARRAMQSGKTVAKGFDEL